MEHRNNRNETRHHLSDDRNRYQQVSNQTDRERHSRQDKEPSGHYRRDDSRRILWENDLYERQSL